MCLYVDFDNHSCNVLCCVVLRSRGRSDDIEGTAPYVTSSRAEGEFPRKHCLEHTNKQTSKQTNKQTHKHTNKQTNE